MKKETRIKKIQNVCVYRFFFYKYIVHRLVFFFSLQKKNKNKAKIEWKWRMRSHESKETTHSFVSYIHDLFVSFSFFFFCCNSLISWKFKDILNGVVCFLKKKSNKRAPENESGSQNHLPLGPFNKNINIIHLFIWKKKKDEKH